MTLRLVSGFSNVPLLLKLRTVPLSLVYKEELDFCHFRLLYDGDELDWRINRTPADSYYCQR